MSEVKPFSQLSDELKLTPSEEEAKRFEGMTQQEIVTKNLSEYDPLLPLSGMVGLYAPHFNDWVNKLTRKQAQRVLKAAVLYPLEDITINSKNKLEHSTYILADKILLAKYLLIIGTSAEANKNEKSSIEKVSEEFVSNAVEETKQS